MCLFKFKLATGNGGQFLSGNEWTGSALLTMGAKFEEGILTSTNIDSAKAIVAAFNARDWDTLKAGFADACMFTDGRGSQHVGGEPVATRWGKLWVEMFSDVKISEDNYYDAGETVTIEFVERGTNDGFFGPLPPSELPINLAVAHVLHFNDEGRVTFGREYFDQLTLMQQLGYA